MGDPAGGLATRPAESPGSGLAPDLALNKGKKSAAVEICRDGAEKNRLGVQRRKQMSLKRCVID